MSDCKLESNLCYVLYRNIQEENDYGYEKNSYPLEQLDADIENMMNSDEFKDAIESLKYEMEKEYYENK